ncbi:uncharacterized protein LOC101456679 isoform X1 [Ceratitis capitata]|uniref:uncharacterized protein LOC101456679 isoform X1 n=1 Tax=Ceratitis capitata TaxID=7213 RepID=UPI0003298B01|nr:uncharacterized protein LOC101456679 isoform X1 [Ceratitis capitata]
MDTIILHSDIARLVLGYLKRQNLERTSRLFCKTSPHLKQYFTAYRKGLTPHSFCPDLEEIICEYVNITETVDNIVASLSSKQRFELFELKLSNKVKLLLERALHKNSQPHSNESLSQNKNDAGASTTRHSDKENTTKNQNKQKRKRATLAYSSDDQQISSFSAKKICKRRRTLEPFLFVSPKECNHRIFLTASTGDDQTPTDDENEVEDTLDDDSNDNENGPLNETDISHMEKPTKESTPLNRSDKRKFSTPSVPELSQAILSNPQFQMKLVDNINQALNTASTQSATETASNKVTNVNIPTENGNISEEQQIINSNEMLDQMVKDILQATEEDPAFDDIIENVVGATKHPTNVSAGVQCNINTNAPQTVFTMPTVSAVVGQQHQQFTFVQQQQTLQQQPQQLTIPCISAVTQQSTDQATAPRTPLIIRTAVATGNTSLTNAANEGQVISTLTANNSFSSLIDPNFSISKLIVLNPNESAQKQQHSADHGIGNNTADTTITQLANGANPTGDEQIFYDVNNAQLTFPMFLTDDGLLTHFPFLVNNETITQQLRAENINNLDAPMEIPLSEPIMFSAGQLPPNTVIRTSTQKAVTAEDQRLPGVLAPTTVCKKQKDALAPTSLNVRSTQDETPSTSGIVNTKAFKSLSTPRKRTSHVRTLSFSPKASATTRHERKKEPVVRPTAIAEEDNVLENSDDVSERPIIKNVEILPCLGGTIDESSNSCSVPPLFVTEESSNQTVIKTELSHRENREIESKIAKTAVPSSNSFSDTPKRKQVRKTAVRACKRQLSKSSDECDSKVKSTTQPENIDPKKRGSECEPASKDPKAAKLADDKMMEEWQRLRNASAKDFDLRLRQLNAELNDTLTKPPRRRKNAPGIKRNLRRRKSAISRRKRKKARDEAYKSVLEAEAEAEATDNKTDERSGQIPQTETIIKEKTLKRLSKDKSKEFNIKIPTPQKDKRESVAKVNNESDAGANVEFNENTATMVVDANNAQPIFETENNPTLHKSEEHERDRRTANIACLLDTPFKEPTINELPPTPGMPMHALDTPASKLRTSGGEMQLSTSYLFGSLTKSEQETPLLSALTPGFRFTPFGLSRDATPRSLAPGTDYSSGGSYYKPDESEDLDRNFDKLLRDSAQKQKQVQEEEEERAKMLDQNTKVVEVKNALFAEEPKVQTEQPSFEQTEEAAICVEIPVEKLRVEPIVLKRVKSFGAESTENTEGGSTAPTNIDPHYTLVSELPEICAQGESSNSSSTYSTTSSSSSNGSSTSSSSSTSSATSSEKKATPSELGDQRKSSENLRLSLDNLSVISSTEDEEWQKLAVTEEENSQLVSNDGEVRYPVRSWLTPSKNNSQSTDEIHERGPAATIKVTVPLKSAEKKNRLEDDLQQKRERVMEKLKEEAIQQRERLSKAPITSKSVMTAAKTSRRLTSMRERAKILPAKATMPPTIETLTQTQVHETPVKAKPPAEAVEKRSLAVLTALQLSVKKQPPAQLTTAVDERKVCAPAVAPPIAALDDNATSIIFTSSTRTTTAYEFTEKTEHLPLDKLISKAKVKQRQCVQIDALPVVKASRSINVGRKKIVRKPLGFKGTLASDIPVVVEELEEVKLPGKASMRSAVKSDEEAEKDAGDGPVPRIKIKTPTGRNTVPASKLRVSPRLQGKKKLKKLNDSDEEEDEDVPAPKAVKPARIVKTRSRTAKNLVATAVKTALSRRKRVTKTKTTAQTDEMTADKDDDDHEDERKERNMKQGSDDMPKNIQSKERLQPDIEKPCCSKDVKKLEREKAKNKTEFGINKEEKKLSKTQKVSTKTTTDSKKLTKNLKTNAKVKITDEDLESTQVTKAKDMMLTKPEKLVSKETVHSEEINQSKDQNEKVTKEKDDESPTTSSASRAVGITDMQARTSENKIDDETDGRNLNSNEVIENLPLKPTEKNNAKEEKNKSQTHTKSKVETKASPTSTTNTEPTPTESSEDDPLEGCELTTVTEDDPIRFISVTYNGPDSSPPNPLPRRDFSNFKMVVAFDEDEKHVWRVSDELMLFNASPATQPIRNIPKKRKVRINTCSSEQDDAATVGIVHSTTTTIKATNSAKASATVVSSSERTNQAVNVRANELEPSATSTPISAPATSSTQEPRRRTSRQTAKVVEDDEVPSNSTEPTPSTQPTTQSSAGSSAVLQIDDIESLLSRLHGKED